ncbi:MAG: TonB-dependent receptor [Tannerella sp.]|jgi:TonB-linked SusC/RagA family outer membrane protein|nr:TonB-dependent receptor [Tannerella sp.]
MQKSITGFIALIFMLCTSTMALAQFRVTGTITDSKNEPLIGVSVQVKGTTIGMATDVDGKYELQVPNAQSVLTFSYVGFITQEITVGNQRNINVVLEEDFQTLEEVVVVGYGVQKKETVTGSVTTVKGEDLLRSPATNLSQAIVGRLSGVVTYQRSGEPGYDDATIRIRGVSSFGETEPLVVIDGVADRAGGLSRLDPNEIESMSVLKDGAAAIYGARAANGVILITTKKGTIGKPVVEFAANFGVNTPTMLPKMSNAWEYAELRNERLLNDAMTASNPNPSITLWKTPEEIEKYKEGSDPWRYPNTDWYDATFKDWTPQSYYTVSLSGGTDKMTYFANFGYRSQGNNFIKGYGGEDIYNLRINLDAQVNDYIKTSVSLMGREERFKRGTQSPGDNLWFTSRGRPTDIAYWPNGLPGPAQEYGRNPVISASRETGYLHENTYTVQSLAKTEITQPWIEGLKLTLSVSYDKRLFRYKQFYQPWYLYTWDGSTVDGNNIPVLNKVLSSPGQNNMFSDPALWERASDQTNTTLSALLTYDRTFGDHGVNILVGAEKDTGNKNEIRAFRRYFLSDAVQTLDAGGDLEKNNDAGGAGNNWDRRRMNYFGRVAYNYKEKYLAEFLWRYDGSYMFPADTRFGFFPGLLLGYRISEEDFWKSSVPFIDYFKIRASYATIGYDRIYYNDALQEYQYYATYRYGAGTVINGQDVKTIELSRLPNMAITWERQDDMNVGIEGRTLDSRLSFEFDAFLKKRSNILWRRNASIPQTAGLTLPAENIGKMDNKGFDFRLAWDDRIGRDFVYQVALTGGYAQNKIVFWDEAAGTKEWQRSTGKKRDAGLYFEYDGVFKTWEEVQNKTLDYSGVTANSNMKPGDIKFKDIDGNGIINGDDRVRINRTNIPTWNMGLQALFQYKGFDLNLLFQGAFDSWTKVYHDSGDIGNWTKEIYDNHWSIANPSDKYPRVHARQVDYWDQGDGGNNTWWMWRTDYIRLKNAELGYTIPRQLLAQTNFISSLRIYVNGQNLFTYAFSGIQRDPEVTQNNATNYPLLKVFNAGFSVTF